jgi:hypothetical protein
MVWQGGMLRWLFFNLKFWQTASDYITFSNIPQPNAWWYLIVWADIICAICTCGDKSPACCTFEGRPRIGIWFDKEACCDDGTSVWLFGRLQMTISLSLTYHILMLMIPDCMGWHSLWHCYMLRYISYMLYFRRAPKNNCVPPVATAADIFIQ